MGLVTFTTDFQSIAKQEFLRPNFRYRYFFDIENAEIYPSNKFIRLKYVLKEIHSKKIPKGELEFSEYLVDLGNIERRFNNLINLEKVKEIGSDKNILQKGDIIIPKIQPQMGNIFLNLEHKRYIGSTELIEYSISEDTAPLFLYYLITTSKFLASLAKLESGKTHRRVNSIDLLKIKIPLIPKSKQDKIVAQIEPIEKKIKERKAQIKQLQEVTNKVFARDLIFNLDKFEELKKEKFFEVELKKIDTPLIRSTCIQNKLSSNYLKSFLTKNSIPLKDILLKPIKRGKQPKYSEDGIKVIKTLNIQKGKINFDEVEYVSEKFLKENEEKAGIYKNDLLLTSTGEGRGKFALYEGNEVCFADSHISIIRFNCEKFLPYFLNYYCQSFFASEQLKYIEMHIKGTPEIYETQLNFFQIPNISLKSQKRIVNEIKEELDKQEELNKKIGAERERIDDIIKDVITG